MEQIARQQGIKWTHIPYKGNAETNSALLGGHIDAVADGSGWASLVNEHKFRLLVTFGGERTKSWADRADFEWSRYRYGYGRGLWD
jgi:tripartite-type tricarboxylate transporter receptor subunit TctC